MLILIMVTPAPAQIQVAGRLGATWSSVLITDEIVAPIEVKSGIAPTLSLSASIPSGPRYRLGLETVLSTGSVHASENGVKTDLGSLRTAALLFTAEGPLMVRGFYWRGGVGLLKYLPSDKEGLFRDGGPTRLTGNLTAEYRKALRSGWELSGGVRYGYHQFITQTLESRGFSRAQVVHRVGLELGVARYFQ